MKIDVSKIIEIEREKLGFPKDFEIKIYEMYPKDFIAGICEPEVKNEMLIGVIIRIAEDINDLHRIYIIFNIS